MTNLQIRKKAKQSNIHLWQIANKLGITDSTFSRKLRFELPKEETQKILDIIDELAKDSK